MVRFRVGFFKNETISKESNRYVIFTILKILLKNGKEVKINFLTSGWEIVKKRLYINSIYNAPHGYC